MYEMLPRSRLRTTLGVNLRSSPRGCETSKLAMRRDQRRWSHRGTNTQATGKILRNSASQRAPRTYHKIFGRRPGCTSRCHIPRRHRRHHRQEKNPSPEHLKTPTAPHCALEPSTGSPSLCQRSTARCSPTKNHHSHLAASTAPTHSQQPMATQLKPSTYWPPLPTGPRRRPRLDLRPRPRPW